MFSAELMSRSSKGSWTEPDWSSGLFSTLYLHTLTASPMQSISCMHRTCRSWKSLVWRSIKQIRFSSRVGLLWMAGLERFRPSFGAGFSNLIGVSSTIGLELLSSVFGGSADRSFCSVLSVIDDAWNDVTESSDLTLAVSLSNSHLIGPLHSP